MYMYVIYCRHNNSNWESPLKGRYINLHCECAFVSVLFYTFLMTYKRTRKCTCRFCFELKLLPVGWLFILISKVTSMQKQICKDYQLMLSFKELYKLKDQGSSTLNKARNGPTNHIHVPFYAINTCTVQCETGQWFPMNLLYSIR